jgi:membrane-associated phospholipid phosphatase
MSAVLTPQRPVAAKSEQRPVARVITDMLEPRNWMIALVIVLGWNADRLAGVSWGLLMGLFAAIFPVLFVRHGVRHWHWTGKHVSRKGERLAALAFIVGSDAAGAGSLWALHAPPRLTGYVLGMLVTSVAIAAITVTWKISVHCSVASATVMLLALACSPLVLIGYPLVGLVAWSRVALREHTIAQVVGGTTLGATAALLTHLAV